MEYYVQCEFVNGNMKTTAWIPEEGAKVGHSMLFKDDKDSGRWTVSAVGAKLLKKEVMDKRSDVFASIK